MSLLGGPSEVVRAEAPRARVSMNDEVRRWRASDGIERSEGTVLKLLTDDAGEK
jgi:hypothetical protein